MNAGEGWWAELTNVGPCPWTPTLQADGGCFSLPIGFPTERQCLDWIAAHIIGSSRLQTGVGTVIDREIFRSLHVSVHARPGRDGFIVTVQAPISASGTITEAEAVELVRAIQQELSAAMTAATDEPGSDVKAVRDCTGTLWTRSDPSPSGLVGWYRDGIGIAKPWSIVARYAPVTDATDEVGATGKRMA